MAEPTPFAITQLFTNLVGKDVAVSLVLHPAEAKGRKVFGIYEEVMTKRAMVVRADLALMGSLAGALLGLPTETAVERALETPMDESLRDALNEVLNIASTIVSSDERVIFIKMVQDPVFCEGGAADVLRAPDLQSHFSVSFDSQPAGLFTILSRL